MTTSEYMELFAADQYGFPYTVGCITIPQNVTFKQARVMVKGLKVRWRATTPVDPTDTKAFRDWLDTNTDFKKKE